MRTTATTGVDPAGAFAPVNQRPRRRVDIVAVIGLIGLALMVIALAGMVRWGRVV